MSGLQSPRDILKDLHRFLLDCLAAGRYQLRNFDAMMSAGREMDALLASGRLRAAAPGAERRALLWRTFEKHGIDLDRSEPGPRHQQKGNRDRDTTVEECITLAKVELQVARLKLTREIASYPTPIAGCDVQFNHLLAARSKIAVALAALDQEAPIPSPKPA